MDSSCKLIHAFFGPKNNEFSMHQTSLERQLGEVGATIIAFSIALAFPLNIVLPGFFAEYSSSAPPQLGPIFLAFALFSILLYLSSQQLRIASRRKSGKNSPICQLAFEIIGQRAAFLLVWSQLLDFLSALASTAHSLSEHSAFLFHPKTTNSFTNWPQIDFVSIVLPIFAALILFFNLRVLLTITFLFLIAALFTMASTGSVAILRIFDHKNATNMANLLVDGHPANSPLLPQFLPHWLILAFIPLEAISFLSEECTHSMRTIPQLFPRISNALTFISFVAFLAFFPLLPLSTNSSQSQLFLPLPALFNPVQLFSARYLMSVGSIFALLAAHLCLFLLTTRLCFLLANEFLKWKCKMAKNMKSISALLALLVVFGILFIPKCWIFRLVPMNLAIRMNFQAILVYLAHFLPNNSAESIQQEYRRIRGTGEEEEDELSDEDLEEREYLIATGNNPNHQMPMATENGENSSSGALSVGHNCLHSSCQIAGESASQHLYEPEMCGVRGPRIENGSRAAAVLDENQALLRAKWALTGIGLLAFVCAVSAKALMERREYTPMMALLALVISPPLSLWLAIWLARTRFDAPFPADGGAHQSNKWGVPLGSLFSMFFLLQMIVLFFSSFTQSTGLAIWNLFGFFVHSISNSRGENR